MNHSYGVKTFATAAHTLYSIFVRLHLDVWARVALIAICEHEKSYVGEVKRNNSMHVIHLNNQPMLWIITHCKHLDTLGKILNCNQCLYCCEYKEENPHLTLQGEAYENAQ